MEEVERERRVRELLTKSTTHTPPMNKVKTFIRRISPFAFDIVDEEFKVGWDPGWLNWGEICADDFATLSAESGWL